LSSIFGGLVDQLYSAAPFGRRGDQYHAVGLEIPVNDPRDVRMASTLSNISVSRSRARPRTGRLSQTSG
jgi:hypothetical protein